MTARGAVTASDIARLGQRVVADQQARATSGAWLIRRKRRGYRRPVPTTTRKDGFDDA